MFITLKPLKDIRSGFYSLVSSKEIVSRGGCLREVAAKRSASSELEGVVDQLDYSKNIYLQIVNESGHVSRSINGIQFIIWKVTLALDELKEELAEREARLAALGDAYADFGQDVEHLTAHHSILDILCVLFSCHRWASRSAVEEHFPLFLGSHQYDLFIGEFEGKW